VALLLYDGMKHFKMTLRSKPDQHTFSMDSM